MKINWIIPFKRLSGGIKVAFLYANYLSEQGHDVICYMPMISYRGKTDSIPFCIKASISNTFKPEDWFKRKFVLKKIPMIKSQFIREADIVIATSWQTAYDVAKLEDKKGKKVYFVQDYEIFNGTVEKVDGTFNLGLNIITITEKFRDFFKKKFKVESYVIYNGIDEEAFCHTNKSDHKLPSIMLMYHEAEHKGTKEALKIVKALKEKYPDLQINIFGRKLGKDVPVYANVLENPKSEDLFEMYKESDIYLFTSKREGWGLPILEAMASKCAVVGFKIGALEEIYNEKNAIIIDNFDFNQMKDKLEYLISDMDFVHKVQINGFETAQKFHWKESFRRMEAYLKNVIKK